MFERIMVPLDGTRFAEQALPYARDLAETFKSTLCLTTVVSEQRGTESAAIVEGIDPDRIEETIQADMGMARDYLESVGHDLNSTGLTVQSKVYEGSSTAEQLIYAARDQHIDLVVIATHGRSGLERTFRGSVADQLMRDPAFPVLAVRAEQQS